MILNSWLYGLKVAILIATGFEQSEMIEPKKALEEAGATVEIVSLTEGKIQGWDWIALEPRDYFAVDTTVKHVTANDYDALLLPGGLNSPDDLRLDEGAVSFVKGFKDKPIAAICHGPWLLINADLVKNRTVTSWPSIKIDLINAGGTWIDREVVVDGNLITSRMPADIPAFNQAMIELFAKSVPAATRSKIAHKSLEVENCLKTCYHIDEKSIPEIILKFTPLITNLDYHDILDDFIAKSKNISIKPSTSTINAALLKNDAVLQAPEWHEILFESPSLRILWGRSSPGDHEPFHTHQWPSLMVITQAGKFAIKSPDGSIETDVWPAGVYELPAETVPLAYTNVGESEFQALRFEIKD